MSGWSEDRVETLKKLWANGLSASQIANRLGGVTRNAVISKVHRLGIADRLARRGNGKATRSKRRPRTQPPPARSDAEFPPVTVDPDFIGPPFLMTVCAMPLFGACRWPIGDPPDADFHFCGRSCDASASYCEFHAGVSARSAAARRKKAARAKRETKARQNNPLGISGSILDSDMERFI